MNYAITTTVNHPYADTVQATRDALAEQGFGILTEIDIAATLKAKIGADVAPHVILGACRPPLAYSALQAESSIGLLLPCNVVVRAADDAHTIVEAMDPDVMVKLTGNAQLREVAGDARGRLTQALASLTPHS